MPTRRDFLKTTLGASSLLAVGGVVPEFLATTALAAEKDDKKKDTVLVVVELTGGNDGLNTVAPYGDDLYQKARPTLAFAKKDVLKLDDYHGLHPRLGELKRLYDEKRLAVVQGVGYPNPDRSHFESMDIWQLADPKRAGTSGWLARAIPGMRVKDAGVPGMYLGDDRLPVAMQGADGGVISLADRASFKLQLTGNQSSRKSLIESLNSGNDAGKADLAAFVRKRQLQTYTSLQKIEDALREAGSSGRGQTREFVDGRFVTTDPDSLNTLSGKLGLIGRMIQKGLGTRLYYVQLGGFDTHSEQAEAHAKLLGELSSALGSFFNALTPEHSERVAVMTYSEFGRRVKENGSRGTDHGSGSCMFVAGSQVVGGLVGKHPSLSDLTDGDVKYHTDFRRVYATLLDDWLEVDSRGVLDDTFEKLPLIDRKKKAPKGTPTPPTVPPGSAPLPLVEEVPPPVEKM
ncbi:hypothetical protein GobsT_72340 [Gemmata obscuriglobus]|uniref:DUF1501 domain-containing protein n=1 Tax=Gemmata obscuriglobus TaxID=114 RepID=A0A2Z3H9X9_9BACT|nr:DUF1501 domain-containing protein [Gemmata obscuriglobus]AWM41681.1 DUF1501 domain-containing protein [Gemmata obscuriglobus]QEG32379.1 hypothetical protein GobsT_72340 [Gemmata obscuriglobus]VTS11735.1 Uncharacterized protein OS=Singulisphaera acidiphila (strain ATCC BAA-1392 / DSM 18658 / VKM B-2454 / MOB10) GN=Sinac_7508 PE=4 SV=1: DUF1501 [Gemmata obscuriglobus UQM 2246]